MYTEPEDHVHECDKTGESNIQGSKHRAQTSVTFARYWNVLFFFFTALLQHNMQISAMARCTSSSFAFTVAMELIAGHQSSWEVRKDYTKASASPPPLPFLDSSVWIIEQLYYCVPNGYSLKKYISRTLF